jgi:hypothetical protein
VLRHVLQVQGVADALHVSRFCMVSLV